MLAQLVSVALTASVKATDTKCVSSFNHFLFKIFKGDGESRTIYCGWQQSCKEGKGRNKDQNIKMVFKKWSI